MAGGGGRWCGCRWCIASAMVSGYGDSRSFGDKFCSAGDAAVVTESGVVVVGRSSW